MPRPLRDPFLEGLARLVVLLPLPACGANCDEALPSEADLCVGDVDCEAAPPAVVELGERDGHGFAPWTEDQTVEVVEGPQGGFMVLPTVCVQLPAAEEACLLVQLDNTFDGTAADAGSAGDDEDGGVHARYLFHRDGDRLCAGPLYDLLTYSRSDLALGGVTIDAAVCGAGGSGSVRRRVSFSPPP